MHGTNYISVPTRQKPSTIGIIGMSEAVQNLSGQKESLGTARGKSFANQVLDHMCDTMVLFQKGTKHHYNLEATPAEGASYRMALIDQKAYPRACFANGVGQQFMHLPRTGATSWGDGGLCKLLWREVSKT